jgi:hypothetical protein
VLAPLVVEADVVVEPALPVFHRRGADAVSELLLDDALDPLQFAVEVGRSRPDPPMAGAQTAEEEGEIVADLEAVVRLDAAQWEGDGLEEPRKGATDGSSGALLSDRCGEQPAAVVHQGELLASLGEVLEVHLGLFSWQGLSVARPDGLRLAGPAHQSATTAEDPVHAAQAAGDEAGVLQIGIEAPHSPAQLAVGVTDGIQDLTGESVGAAPRPPGAIQQRSVALTLPACPPTGEGGIRNLCGPAKAAGTETPALTAHFVGYDVSGPCGRGPWSANLVHVGPPCSD